MFKKVNLGCGDYKLEDYINVDNREKVNPDIVADILVGLPFEDSSIDEVSCTEFLEHFDQVNMVIVFHEIYRILKRGGVFRFGTPNGMECALLLAGYYWDNEKRSDVDSLWNNVYGQKDLKLNYKDRKEIEARLHKTLFNEQYLILLLKRFGFKDIKFNEHMKAYEEWKEKYKLIGKATKS